MIASQRRRRSGFFSALLLIALVASTVLAIPALAQGTYGSLTGQVTDPLGALIPNATVTLTNVGTNSERRAPSDASGVYLFKLVSPGNYSLKISASGFADYVQTGIVMNANLNATQNVQLAVGGSTQTVNVVENASLINTTSAELGTTVNQYSVSQLPLNGRDPSALALLAPGMVQGTGKLSGFNSQSGFSFPGESSASANGGRQGSTYYMLDGVSNMDSYLASNSPTPNADATQEFRLISNNYSAMYGFSSGGVVSLATKSGSNEWHGGLFEFLRNQELNAKSWTSRAKDPLKRNQFGGYVGGPALKNKLFFFANYQGTRQVGTSAGSSTSTPTQQMLNGDYSGLIDYAIANSGGTCGTNYLDSPRTTKCGWLIGPFQTVNGKPNQVIGGAAGLNSASVLFTNDGLPGHDAPATGTAPGTLTNQNLAGGIMYTAAALRQNMNEYTGRLDYDLSSSQRVTLRSFVDKFTQPSSATPGNVLSVLNLNNWQFGLQETMWYFNELAQHTWTLNANTVNTASVFWTEQSVHNGAQVLDHAGKPMCWSRYISISEPTGCSMEGASFGPASGGWTEPSQEVRSATGFSDTLIKTVHRHTISAGLELQKHSAVENSQYPADAMIGFGGSYTGNGIADWMLGYMSSYTQGAGEISDVKGWLINPFVNDEFRVKPGLTLTLGLRWDPDIAPTQVGGRGAAFVPGQKSIAFPGAPTGLIFPGDAGMSAQLRPSNYAGYFEPRVGIAYQPKRLPNTSFHAAFGMFSGPVAYSMYNHAVDIAPFSPSYSPTAPSNTPVCYTNGVMNPNGGACTDTSGQVYQGTTIQGYMDFQHPWSTSTFGTNGVNPFPPFASVGNKPTSGYIFPSVMGIGASFSRNFKAQMTNAWNASAEHQLSKTMSVRIAYVGSEAYHQSYLIDRNFARYCETCNNGGHGSYLPNPNFTSIVESNSNGTASYNSLQIHFQRSMANGMQAQSSFTWQKTIDLSSGSNSAFDDPLHLGNPFDLKWNRGISSLSIPFTSTSSFVYVSPELKGKNVAMRELLGGWELSPILTLQSGNPFTIASGNSSALGGSNNGTGSGCKSNCNDRANRVPGQALNVRHGDRSQWIKGYFNKAAFAARPDGTFGTSGRNIMNGPPTFNVDAALIKNWSVERYQIQLRFEMFNAFNHPVMSNPDTNPTSSTFGQINGGRGSAANAARLGQAALKFSF
jgi:hypothetical protein